MLFLIALLGVSPLAGAASGPPAEVEDEAVTTPSPILDHFAIRGAVIVAKIKTNAQIDDSSAGVAGNSFSAESDFGLADSRSQGRVEFVIRLKNRGRLRVSALDSSRKATVRLNRNIRYGTQSLLVTDLVTSQMDWRAYDFTWTYSFLRSDRFELGAGLGVHLLQSSLSATVPARAVHEQFDGAGPYLTMALDSTWRITRRFSVSARAQTFELKVNSSSAKLTDYHADVQFRWRKNLAFGLGYQRNNVNLNVTNEDPSGTLDFDIAGPEVFLRASF
jgi:hypothetical protein